jgi:chromosome segregation ATPase
MARGRPSTASSIPVPKGKQPRSSSLNPEINARRLEDDLRTTRASLASTESALRAAEEKLSHKTNGLLKAENEKFALEKRFAAERAELHSALEEAQDELRFARQTVDPGVTREEYEGALSAGDAVRAELVSMTVRNRELEGKLQRKTDQLAAAQERLEELQFQDPHPPIEQALQDARNEAAHAKEELALFSANVKVCVFSRSYCRNSDVILVLERRRLSRVTRTDTPGSAR